MGEFDFKKDYYKILDVSPDATLSELKIAHRSAVLRYHPDIAGQSQKSTDKFREVQDAYKILSTPELKAEYDKHIGRKTKKTSSSPDIVPGTAAASIYSSESMATHSLQRKNFEENVLMKASSTWSENLPKYKTERWKKVPLEEKKMSRVRPVWTFRKLFSHGAPYVFLTGAVFAWYCYFSQPHIRNAHILARVESILPKKNGKEMVQKAAH